MEELKTNDQIKNTYRFFGGKRWIKNPGINNIRRNGKAENLPDGLVLTVFFISVVPIPGRSGRMEWILQESLPVHFRRIPRHVCWWTLDIYA